MKIIQTCGMCKYAKPRGRRIVYCTYFGIDIRRDYQNCRRNRSKIIMEGLDAEIDRGRGGADVWTQEVS